MIKTRYFTLAAALWLIGLSGGCSGEGSDATPAAGQESFLRYCASCHGNTGEGKPPSFPPLTDPDWVGLPGEALALIALYGLSGEIEAAGRSYRGFMPPLQHMRDEDIAAAVGYIQTQWGTGEATLDADRIMEIRRTLGQRPPWQGREELKSALEKL